MKRKEVGLIDLGSKDWIAGHIYIKSLVYANSLLPEDQRLDILLFYKHSSFITNDYDDIRNYVKIFIPYDDLYKVTKSWKDEIFRWLSGIRTSRPSDNSLQTQIKKYKCNLIFPSQFTQNPGCNFPKTVSWIPDFQHLHYPQFFSDNEIVERNSHFTMLFKHSDIVILSNEFSRKDAINFSHIAREKARVLPFRIWLGSEWSRVNYGESLNKYQLPDKYLIFPSQFWIHKNHRMLFDAFARLVDKGTRDIMLVCTGNKTDYRHPSYLADLMKFIDDKNLHDNIRILGLISRADQVQLMRGAAAIIQPSLFEGWSALLEEARMMGKQVFVSDIPMHREQKPDNCIFFSPADPEDLADCLSDAWPGLKKGPDPNAEEQAMIKYQYHLYSFGLSFRNICDT